LGHKSCSDAAKDSDYDVALLRDMPDLFAEMKRLADLSTDVLNETGEFIYLDHSGVATR
jgi:uncharacterized protein